jgi:hypothetical protein
MLNDAIVPLGVRRLYVCHGLTLALRVKRKTRFSSFAPDARLATGYRCSGMSTPQQPMSA